MFKSKINTLLYALLGCAGCTADRAELPIPMCETSSAMGIAITNRDVYGVAPYALGYPQHAADGCLLLYVAPSNNVDGNGELRLRDLSTGKELVIAGASTAPRRPVLSGDWMAWEADVNGRTLIHTRNQNDGNSTIIDGAFDHATEPRISTTAIAFTAWLGPETTANTDVALYTFAEKEIEILSPSPGQQRFADISNTHVAWSDFSEDPDGRFDEDMLDVAEIVVYDRQKKTTTVRTRLGKQAFPMLGAQGKIAFLDWNLVHPEPKLVAYDLRLVDIDDSFMDSVLVESIKTALPYIRPVARGELLEWVALVEDVGPALWRMRTDAVAVPVLVQEASSINRFAPVASETMTFVGVQSIDGSVTLEAFAR